MSENLPIDELRQICLDYVNAGLSKKEVCNKYHITPKLFNKIHLDYRLEQKKLDFRNKVLNKDMHKLATISARGFASGMEFCSERIEKLRKHEVVLEKEGKLLPSSFSKEIQSLMVTIFDVTKYRDSEKYKSESKRPNQVNVVFETPAKKENKDG